MEHVLAGLYVPLVTPLRADGELAADALETLAHSVIDAGAAGLVALGTTGEPATLSAEGYRLIWYHSTRKAEQDASARHQQVERALNELAELRLKLSSSRTRYRQEAKVADAVQEILGA